jgi:glutamate racemase
MDDRPIGMFDSGFGGLTVARAVIDLLPDEDLVYIGDTGRYPYGPRPLSEVRAFAQQIARHLIDEFDVKLVVVACNTASAAALDVLQAACDVPVVGVIEPGARSLIAASRTGRVGVIGTVGTIASGAYQRAVDAMNGRESGPRWANGGDPPEAAAPEVELTCAACPGLVEFVEKGETNTDQVYVLVERLLAPLRQAKVDTLLLGCTHYPFLARAIGDIMGRDVVLVSSADETAFEVRRLLIESGLARTMRGEGDGMPVHRWLSSGDVASFAELGRALLGPELAHAEAVSWDDADLNVRENIRMRDGLPRREGTT